MKIAVTVNDCQQIGIETWEDVPVTAVFDESKSIKDILTWAGSVLKRPVTSIGMLRFGDYEGEIL